MTHHLGAAGRARVGCVLSPVPPAAHCAWAGAGLIRDEATWLSRSATDRDARAADDRGRREPAGLPPRPVAQNLRDGCCLVPGRARRTANNFRLYPGRLLRRVRDLAAPQPYQRRADWAPWTCTTIGNQHISPTNGRNRSALRWRVATQKMISRPSKSGACLTTTQKLACSRERCGAAEFPRIQLREASTITATAQLE